MCNLQTVLTKEFDLDLEGWQLFMATDISANGTVSVGTDINPNSDIEAWIAHLQ
jgi:hypothetical protein